MDKPQKQPEIDAKLTLKHVVVLAHPQVPGALNEAARIAEFLVATGIQADHGYLYDEALRSKTRRGDYDLLIALGGDGTMLRAGHLGGPCKVPILGINLGKFGFLTEIRKGEWPKALPRLLSGDYWLERRMMLCAQQWRGSEKMGEWEVLNEAAVSRGRIVRPIRIETHVDGRYLTTYVADALIAATPTGSTAYGLAAGGPILPPELRNILIVPVAPHLSVERAIVLAEGAVVSFIARTDHEALLSIDGQAPIDLMDGDRVEVRAAEHTVQFVRFQDPGYFYRNLTPHMNNNPSAGILPL